MARVQAYLPDDLHAEAKARDLPISRLLQEAVRSALRRERLDAELERYLTELCDEVGEPSKPVRARAAVWAKRVVRRGSPAKGKKRTA